MFNINPFLMYTTESNNTIVQTNKSMVVVSHTGITELLNYIEENNLKVVTQDIISNYFEENEAIEAIKFLIENNIIFEDKPKSIDFNEIVLLCNDTKFTELFRISFCEYIDKINLVTEEELEDYIFEKEDLLIVFMNPFSLKNYNKLIDKIKKSNILSKFIFYYNHSVYISNFYKREWYNPCPRCFFSNLENHLRGGINNDSMNFQALIDLIYEENPSFEVGAKLKIHDYINVIYVLNSQFNTMKNKYNNRLINEVYEIDINNNIITKDSTYYWEVCDCYE